VLGGSIKLVRIFGIRVGVDPSWFFVLFLLIWLLSSSYKEVYPGNEGLAFGLATASALLFFISVMLHELGHALVAVRNGIGVEGIDLWLFGGVAKMRRDPPTAWIEFKVAVAGPVVTLLLVLACFGAGVALGGLDGFSDALDPGSGTGAIEAMLAYLAAINLLLLLFNLIPGYPLDGGRIVRAIAWWRTGDRVRATRLAAGLGRGIAYLMVGLAIFGVLQGYLDTFSGVWLAFIGLFLVQAARGAEVQTLVTSRIDGLRVADVMETDPVAVEGEASVEQALDEYFLRYRSPWFPVIDRAGKFLGLIDRHRVDDVPEAERPGRTVYDVMARDGSTTYRIPVDEPLESLLGSEALQTLGALVAVDREGVVRGVVTLDQLRRALRAGPAAP